MSRDNNTQSKERQESKEWNSTQFVDSLVTHDSEEGNIGVWSSNDCISTFSIEDKDTVKLRRLYSIQDQRRSGLATNMMKMICSCLDGMEVNCKLDLVHFEFMDQQDAFLYVDFGADIRSELMEIQPHSDWLVSFFNKYNFGLVERATDFNGPHLEMVRSFHRNGR